MSVTKTFLGLLENRASYVVHGPLQIDVGAIAALAGAAIALVTLVSLPLLARQMRPSALHTE
jgi:hypothetical protein